MRSLSKDIVTTAITQAAVMMATLLLYGLIARLFGPSGVGEYTIVRRGLYFLQPLTLVGITVAVPRYIAMSICAREKAQIASVGFSLVLFCSLIAGLAIVSEQEWLSVVMFGRKDARDIVYGFAVVTVAFGIHSLAYSYYRGIRDMSTANRLDLVNSCVAPLIALALSVRLGLGALIGVMGAIMIASTAFLSSRLWNDIASFSRERKLIPGLNKSLLAYGLPRIPGDLALAGLLFGGAYIVARQASIQQAGYFGVAQTLLMLPGATLAALSVVLLPYVSERLKVGDVESVQKNATRLFHAIIDVTVYFSLHVALVADVILRLWLGERMVGATEMVRVLMVSVPFYSTYFVFRSVIDAASPRPATTINLVIAFVSFAALYAVSKAVGVESSRAATWSLSAAFGILGGLTLVGVGEYIGIRGFFDRSTKRVFMLNLVIALVVLIARSLVAARDWVWVIVEILCSVVFVLGLQRQKRVWVADLLDQLSRRR
jgi:stage V sporulation protein B